MAEMLHQLVPATATLTTAQQAAFVAYTASAALGYSAAAIGAIWWWALR